MRIGSVFVGKGVLLLIALSLVAALALAITGMSRIDEIEGGMRNTLAAQQDDCLSLVADQINNRSGDAEERAISNALESLDSSSDDYWRFPRDKTILFVKNDSVSDRYQGHSVVTYWGASDVAGFVDSLLPDKVVHETLTVTGNECLVSGTAFSYDGSLYHVCLISNWNTLLNEKGLGSTLGALRLCVVLASLLLVLLPVLIALFCSRRQADEGAEAGQRSAGASAHSDVAISFDDLMPSGNLMPSGMPLFMDDDDSLPSNVKADAYAGADADAGAYAGAGADAYADVDAHAGADAFAIADAYESADAYADASEFVVKDLDMFQDMDAAIPLTENMEENAFADPALDWLLDSADLPRFLESLLENDVSDAFIAQLVADDDEALVRFLGNVQPVFQDTAAAFDMGALSIVIVFGYATEESVIDGLAPFMGDGVDLVNVIPVSHSAE